MGLGSPRVRLVSYFNVDNAPGNFGGLLAPLLIGVVIDHISNVRMRCECTLPELKNYIYNYFGRTIKKNR